MHREHTLAKAAIARIKARLEKQEPDRQTTRSQATLPPADSKACFSLQRAMRPLLVLFGMILILTYVGFAGSAMGAGRESAAYHMAHVLGVGFVIWCVCAILGLQSRKENPWLKWILFLPSLTFYCLWQYPAPLAQLLRDPNDRHVQSVANRMINNFESYMQNPTGDKLGQARGDIISTPLDEIEGVLDEMVDEMQTLNAELAIAFNLLKVEEFWAVTIVGPKGMLTDAIEATRQFDALLPGLLKKNDELVARAELRIRGIQPTSDFGPTAVSAVVASFRESASRAKERNKKLFASYGDLSSTMRSLCEFLLRRQETYMVEDGQVTFYSQDDVDAFNTLATKLGAVGEEIDTQVETTKASMESVIGELRRQVGHLGTRTAP